MFLRMVRGLLVIAFFCVVASTWADREITIPKGKKIRDGYFRAEYLGVFGERSGRAWLGTGFLGGYEIEGTFQRTRESRWTSSFDIAYNYTPPITDIAPGLSVGVQDALNVSENGRAVYIATTYRYGNEGELNQNTPTELTVGFWTRKTGFFFVGASFPFTDKLLFVAEHDSMKAAAGLEFRVAKGVQLKSVFERDGTSLGMSLSHRF